MVSPDGRTLFVDQGTTDFLELDSSTLRVTRRLALPAGWRANPWGALPVAGGLVVTHNGRDGRLGIWRFGRTVRPFGTSGSLLDGYPPALSFARSPPPSRES